MSTQPYTHPKSTKQYDTPASFAARKAAEQQAAIAATAPARKAGQVNETQRGHNLAQSIVDNPIPTMTGPIGNGVVENMKQRVEKDRYNSLTPEARSAEYGAKLQKMQDIAKDPLSHGAQPASVVNEVAEHQQNIKNMTQTVKQAAGGLGVDTSATTRTAAGQDELSK